LVWCHDAVNALAFYRVPPHTDWASQICADLRLITDAFAFHRLKMVVRSIAETFLFGNIAALILFALAFFVVRQRAVWANKVRKQLKRAVATAYVGVPVPIRTDGAAVLDIRAWVGDALTALEVKGCSWRAAVYFQLAPA